MSHDVYYEIRERGNAEKKEESKRNIDSQNRKVYFEDQNHE